MFSFYSNPGCENDPRSWKMWILTQWDRTSKPWLIGMIIKILQPCKMFSSIPKNWQKSLLNKMVVMDHGVSMFPCQSQDCFLPPSSPLSACFRPWWAWSRLTEFPPNPSHIRTRLRHPTTHCCKTRPPYLSKAMFCCLQLSGVKGTTQCAALEPCFDPPPPSWHIQADTGKQKQKYESSGKVGQSCQIKNVVCLVVTRGSTFWDKIISL